MTWVIMECINDREGRVSLGELVVWRGEWYRSPADVEGRERNPILKLYTFDTAGGLRLFPEAVMGETDCYVRASDGEYAPFDDPETILGERGPTG